MTTTGHHGVRRRRAHLSRWSAVAATMGLLLSMTAIPASAGGQGLTADKLQRAGWTCIDQGDELPTPCLPDAESVFSGEADSSVIMTFGPDGQDFWGTEHLIHQDLYNGQPCPQDEVEGGDGGYIHLEPVNGMPYYVCHHFDSPVT